MANNLKVTITATDKATAAINKINASMNRMMAPLNGVQKVGNEIAKNPAVRGLKNMAGAAATVANGLSKISGGMLGITGIGTIAGLAELTAHWARMGREVANTSTSLGVSSRGLTTMRGAAQLAGLSAESMDGSLESLRQNMQDARWGRNQPLVALMSRLNMQFRYTKDGSIDAIASMKDIADMMAAQKDVGAKHTIAQTFGVDSLFTLLNKGRQAIEDYQREIEKLNGTPSDAQIQQNEKFAKSIERMKIAANGVGRDIAANIQQFTQPGIDKAADLVSGHTTLATKLGTNLVKQLMIPLGLAPVVDYLSGFGMVGAAPGQQSASGKIKPLITSTGNQPPLGIRSNNPLNLMPGGREAVYPTMEAGIGAAMRNLMTRRYFGGGNDTAAGIISKWSPANAPGNSPEKTANYISAVQQEVGTGHLDPNDPATMAKLLSAMARQENGAGTYDATKMDQAIQHVVIEFKNAPAGTTATARTASGATVPVRVATAMPAMGTP
jgi:hypothetical protein